MKTGLFLAILLSLFLTKIAHNCYAEGSRELLVSDSSNYGSLQIWDNNDANRQFATWNCDSLYRLNVRVNNGEYIHLGFHQNNNDVWFRVRNPNNQIVMGPIKINNSHAGWIEYYAQAFTGPASLYPGGYNDTSIMATMAGDYYVEFAVNKDSVYYKKRVFEMFDITVSDIMSNEKQGRLWSATWDLTTNGGSNKLMANFYAYSKDSVVTKFDFNGIQPFGFTISCNSYGASNVGSLAHRRKSNYWQNIVDEGGVPGAPEYPLFLNAPDTFQFPTGVFGLIDSFSMNTCEGSTCLNVWVNKSGQVESKLSFTNGTSQKFIDSVLPGENCIQWNGLDGNNQALQAGDTVFISLNYATGITHLPLIDVEKHNNGFSVHLIRPSTKPDGTPVSDPLIFWNDSLLNDYNNSIDGVANLVGAGDSSHQWKSRGTNNSNPEVINTWWYSSSQENSYTIICPVFLEVTLEYFHASVRKEAVHLEWKSSTEQSAVKYIIEKSLDGRHFTDIGSVKARNFPSIYKFIDPNLPDQNSLIYYRLKMKDFDASVDFSKIIWVETSGALVYTFHWVANAHTFKVRSSQIFNYSYQIVDVTGSVLYSGLAESQQSIPIYGLNRGIYFVLIRVNGVATQSNHKIILY